MAGHVTGDTAALCFPACSQRKWHPLNTSVLGCSPHSTTTPCISLLLLVRHSSNTCPTPETLLYWVDSMLPLHPLLYTSSHHARSCRLAVGGSWFLGSRQMRMLLPLIRVDTCTRQCTLSIWVGWQDETATSLAENKRICCSHQIELIPAQEIANSEIEQAQNANHNAWLLLQLPVVH